MELTDRMRVAALEGVMINPAYAAHERLAAAQQAIDLMREIERRAVIQAAARGMRLAHYWMTNGLHAPEAVNNAVHHLAGWEPTHRGPCPLCGWTAECADWCPIDTVREGLRP